MSKKQLNGMVRGFVCSLLAVFISCSEKDLAVTDGEEITTSVTVEVPEVFRTRAVPAGCYPTDATSYLGESGYPSIGNVDLKKVTDNGDEGHPLTFTVAVYVKKTVEGKDEYIEVDKQGKIDVEDDKADFNFRLMKGQTYQIVAYADFSGKEQENLDDISIAPELNNELKDAFFVSKPFEAADNLTVVLKRPFGKLRLIARDFSTFAKGGVLKIEEIKVKYKKTVTALATNSFNAITGEFNNIEEGFKREFTAKPVIYTKEHEGEEPPYAAVFTMYLPVNSEGGISDNYFPVEAGNPVPQSWMHPFDIEITYNNQFNKPITIKRSFDIDIPIKRNWLTTIDVADFWTDNSRITVSIDHRFEGFINMEPETHYVYTEKELRDAVKAIEKTSERTGKIVLGANITLSANYPKATGTGLELGYCALGAPAPYDNESIILDLNGKTLTIDKFPKWTQAVIGIYGPVSLTIEDTSPEANGEIRSPMTLDENGHLLSSQTIISWRYGANIVINGGKIKSCISWSEKHSKYEDLEAIYLADPQLYVGPTSEGNFGLPPSKLTINGGWFECLESNNPEVLINLFNGGQGLPSHPDDIGYGSIKIKGGSFVGFNPANGDNITGTMTNEWVDDNHTVLTETINGKTVYTVIPKNSPEYHD